MYAITTHETATKQMATLVHSCVVALRTQGSNSEVPGNASQMTGSCVIKFTAAQPHTDRQRAVTLHVNDCHEVLQL